MKSFMFLLSIFMIMLPVVGKDSQNQKCLPKELEEGGEEEEARPEPLEDPFQSQISL